VIEEGAVIGDRTVIGSHTFIGAHTKIGEDSFLHPHVTVRERCLLGNRIILHPGVVIGSCGFGYDSKTGTHQKIPQIGIVQVDDDVEIGANTTIDRARFGKTHIGHGTKIDNLVQIAHNVEVGKNTVIAAQAGISGSTKVGENCMLAGQVGIAGHITIANRTSLGAQSGISKSISKEDERLLGYPAIDVKEYFRSYAVFKQLPDLNYRLRELEKKVQALHGNEAEGHLTVK